MGIPTEEGRNRARTRLVGAFDDSLNRLRYVGPGHTLDFPRQPALGGRLPIDDRGYGDGYDNHGRQRQQGIECDGSAQALSIVVHPFARRLPEHSRQRL